ncbi:MULTISPECIES: mechanosensitive ion channel family protein [Haloferax]|uniref:Mechanosensitive ion channel n=2 Tax=Haloferax TaxID=2251 RepID=A0A6G1Z2J5_9EURY|nr:MULTISPECIES: mechanosensitive ion channel family protein [Haloferax]KAB1188087.1 mechanosensitive ion channel family protein [Haloferax sp. CBA1149]MRW80760.1 mechanosensitive ion channel [Haloferax marinisediminis]
MTHPVYASLLSSMSPHTHSIVALQSNAPIDFATLFPSVELRIGASALALAVIVAIWSLGARLHDRDSENVSSAIWHLGVTLFRLVGVVLGGVFLFSVWSSSGDIATLSEQYGLGTDTLVQIALSAAFLVGAYVVTTVLGRLISEVASTRPEISDHQREIIFRLAQVSTYLVAVVVILGIWQADLGGILVGAGFLGIVVGMAARQTLGALIAGFVLMFSRPFEIGDWVEVGNHEGIVTDITVVNTRIQTFDGEYVMIPNDVVSSESLVNRSRKGRLRLEVEVGVDYETDLDHAASVAQDAVESLDETMSVPQPQVVAKRFDDSAVVLGVRPWIDRPSARRKWQAQTAVISAIREAFDEADISIPFPQRELSSRGQSGPVPLTDAPSQATPQNSGPSEGRND